MRATIASCLGVEDLSLHFSVERAIECSSPGGGLASCRMHSHFPEPSINTVTADVDSLYAPHKREKILPMHVWRRSIVDSCGDGTSMGEALRVTENQAYEMSLVIHSYIGRGPKPRHVRISSS